MKPLYRKLLVGYDGSVGARASLSHAVSLAKSLRADLWALWVREAIPYFLHTVDEGAAEGDAARFYAQALKAEIETIECDQRVKINFHFQEGRAAEKIVRYAVEGSFDLIVLGSHGHSALWKGLLGHTTDRISEQAPCSVLIVRPEGRAITPA
jgi:nucleotide-binding universal stress UspA family protein